ncbi:hypothetical protein pb186bvf_014444 [Paramecium bursaria]
MFQMVFSSDEFQNKELEDQYQKQFQKNVLKCGFQYLIVLLIGKCFIVLDNLIHYQFIMFCFVLPFIFVEGAMIYLLRKKQLQAKYIIYFNNLLLLTATLIQFVNYILGDEHGLQQSQLFVILDIAQQFVSFINYGQSFRQNSLTYFIFIGFRVYYQSKTSYTNYSITYILYGLFYVIAQYQMSTQRRKLFLKGQRNQLLEKLIEDFIDEKVCIIEKDEDNVKFIPIIMNQHLKQCISEDINKTIKQLKVNNYKESLQNYLYKTVQQSETIFCKFKNHVYEVSYQRFIIQKCQIFIKIKEIYHNQFQAINYQELYLMQECQLKKLSQQSQQAKKILSQLQDKIFLFWFQKYYLAYKMRVEPFTFQQLKNVLISRGFDIIQFQCHQQEFHTDKQLLCLLLNQVERFLRGRIIKIKSIEYGIQLDIEGIIDRPIKNQQVSFIRKILFHIGLATCLIKQNNDRTGNIMIQLFDIQQENKRYKL